MSETEERPVALVCTVGGSPEPIRSALRALRPSVVWFLVSDGSGGTPSSITHVEGDEGLRRAEGCPPDVVIRSLPPDHLDLGLSACRDILAEMRRTHPGHRIVADYTGGTKTMTASLVMAAFGQPGVEVQLMAGERGDLRAVTQGTEAPHAMAAEVIVADREMALAEQAVAAWDYRGAERILEQLVRSVGRARHEGRPFPDRIARRVETAQRWARLMADWDVFQHGRAVQHLGAAVHGCTLKRLLEQSGHLEPLRRLAGGRADAPGWDLCADLWNNALRRGERERYDDAVARLYRLVEAAIQTQWFVRYGVLTKEVPLDMIPAEVRDEFNIRPTRRGDVELGLVNAARVLHRLDPDDPVAAAVAGARSRDGRLNGPPWLASRNNSILAHGFRTISTGDWHAARRWVENNLVRFWDDARFPQLPDTLPAAP